MFTRDHGAASGAHNSQRGFTLIELSIVLVIIGLIIGGVLKGKDLIDSAKTNKAMLEMEAYAGALQAYQERYNANPRDDGTNRFGATDQPSVGDGREWWLLRKAGLISFASGQTAATKDNPTNAFNGEIRLFVGNVAPITTGMGDANTLKLCLSNIPPKAAAAIAAKYDNGLASSGNVQAASSFAATETVNDFSGSANLVVCQRLN